jgi:hypothetical protein
LQCEWYFPDIDDPVVLFSAMRPHHRMIYDGDLTDTIKELPDYSSKQIYVLNNLTTRTIVAPREFYVKRIFFQVG